MGNGDWFGELWAGVGEDGVVVRACVERWGGEVGGLAAGFCCHDCHFGGCRCCGDLFVL